MDSGPLFRWSKRVAEADLETWETRLALEHLPCVAEQAVGRERWQVSVYDADRDRLEALRQRHGGGVVRVRPEDWQPSAASDSPRLRIRDRFVVVEETDPASLARLSAEHPGRQILSFPPQMAFGTGSHQTTAGCLRQLVDASAALAPGTWELLDLGCGSGILAIAGRKLGARRVTALENDPLALVVARENARRHGEDAAIHHLEGDAIAWCREAAAAGRKFDVVTANLFSELLVALFPALPGVLAPGGTLIVSGFLTSQAKRVADAARRAGLGLEIFVRRGKWVTAAKPGLPRAAPSSSS